jgi:hypothetical protein
MATPPVVPVDLAQPPAQPPEVAAQGAGGGQALAELAARRAAQAGRGNPPGPLAGPADPYTAIRAGLELVRRILEDMARMAPEFAPFTQRALAILNSGMGEIMTRAAGARGRETAESPAPRGRRPAGEAPEAASEEQPFPG